MSVFALHATRSRRIALIVRAIASATIVGLLVSGHTGAQMQDARQAESEANTAEQSAEDATPPARIRSESKPAKRVKRANEPFVPTDRIDAESVVAFPANI